MEESIPSISSGSVGSRFVSQNDIEAVRKKRDEQWKAAYARLGQEPPPQPTEDSYDGRSLAEKLAANKAAKQEEWEERNRLANQFRALEEDEVMFLDTVREAQEEEERRRKANDDEELKSFRVAVAARDSAANKSPPLTTESSPPNIKSAANSNPGIAAKSKKPSTTAPTKNGKTSLKGVLMKKKPKGTVKPPPTTTGTKAKDKDKAKADVDDRPAPKRRKVAE